MADNLKNTNPKDAIGCHKLPMHLWPTTATALGCLALLDGALKYGRANWRASGVRASIYVDAASRHLNAWFEGESVDPDSGIPHLGHALACMAILVDADAAGLLVDDRQVPGGYRPLIEKLTPHVQRLQALHADRAPKHFTISDVTARPEVAVGTAAQGAEEALNTFLVSTDYLQNENTGHGHVFPRPDGLLAKCGGPGLCRECAADAARKESAQ